jgi:hypothetical protein
MNSPNERFHILNNFLGFGNPKSAIWFIGLEEAGEWNSDPEQNAEMYRLYAQGFFPFKPGEISSDARKHGRRYTKVYDIMSKLVVEVLGNTCTPDWKVYRDERLFVEGSNEAFQTNLYPLGKGSLREWPSEYVSLFGLSTAEEYYNLVRKEGGRFDHLRSEHEKYRPQLTICFGKCGWDDFKRLLRLGDQYDDSLKGYRIYPATRVVLSPFFSYRFMSSETIVALGARLRGLFDR